MNVFALHEKYNAPDVQLDAARVHRKLLNTFNNEQSLHSFIDKLPAHSTFDSYKNWYEEEIRAPFESKNFNQQRYSKLYRDLHNFVLKHNEQSHNKTLKEISKNHP